MKKISPYEEWKKEKKRTRIYPEHCPGKDSEVDFDIAGYIINEKKFHYVKRLCGCHADIQRVEKGIPYTFQPGMEGLLSVVYDTLVNTINKVNDEENSKLITSIKGEKDNIFWPAGITKEGEIKFSENPFHGLTDEGKKEQIEDMVYHEAGHRKDRESIEFQDLYEKAKKLDIINWFKDSNFHNENNGSNCFVSKLAGHPEDKPTELYASAYLIVKKYKSKFDEKFYNGANVEQRKIVDNIFNYVIKNNDNRVPIIDLSWASACTIKKKSLVLKLKELICRTRRWKIK